MTKTIFALALLAASALAQTKPTISATGTQVRPGTPATVTFALTNSSGSNTAALQFQSSGYCGATPVFTVGAASTTAGKTLTCQPLTGTPGTFGCVVAGVNTTPLADGSLATAAYTPTCASIIPVGNLLGADAAANSPGISMTAGPPLVVSLSPCDVNGDGKVDNLDVASVAIAAASGQAVGSTGFDLNGDGRIDILDVQRIANAAAGGTCKAGF